MDFRAARWKSVVFLLACILGCNGATTEASNGATTEASNGATTEASNGATTEASNGATTEASRSPLECFLCLEGELSVICGALPTITVCTDVNDVCFWNVSMENGNMYSEKGCMPRQDCVSAESGNDAECAFDEVTGHCTYCCEDGDRCNVDREMNKPDPSTTSVATTTTPDTTTSGECDMYGWEECVLKFGFGVSAAILDPENSFSTFCRSVPELLECLAGASAHCCDSSDSMRETFLRIVGDLTAVCPSTCDQEAGIECTSDLYARIVTSIMEDYDCSVIDRLLVEKKRCVESTVGSCDSEVKGVVVNIYTRIERETEKVCSSDRPISPPMTEPDSCDVARAQECINRLGDVILFGLQNPAEAEYKYLCSLVKTTEECVLSATSTCSELTRWRLTQAVTVTGGLIAEECVALEATVCETSTARACVFELWNAVEEERDMTKACGLVNATLECVSYFMRGCTDREIASLKEMVDMVMAMLDCDNVIEVESPGNQINISECGQNEEATISYRFTTPPSSLCPHPNCKVFIEWELELLNSPRCRNQRSIQQAVINGAASTCADQVTDQNYDQWKTVTVASKLDFKVDGTQSRRLTMWMKKEINGFIEERKSIGDGWTVNVEDCDRRAICSSINDPHMRTFDQLYYDNFYDGHFTMYRHTELPYEVEAIFQKCSHHASCNCGAAIRSGDNVIFFDRCRKKNYQKKCDKYCHGYKQNHKKCDKYDCPNYISVTMYGYDGRLTDGTRVFRRGQGKEYEVVLPHGTVVKIAVNGQYVNIWITPSPADFGKTVGLCGTYNDNKDDDLEFSNGGYYPGYRWGCQPRDFSKSWENKKYDRIYKGVKQDPYFPTRYCECNLNEDGDSQQRCGYNARVEMCDFDTSGEITEELVYKMVKPKIKNKYKRQADEEEEEEDFDFDMSETEDVEDIMARSAYNETYATELCNDYFNNAPAAAMCESEVKINTTVDVDSCVKDLRVTEDASWMVSGLEAIKAACVAEMSLQPKYSEDETAMKLAAEIGDVMCPNDCSNSEEEKRGSCVNGTCECTHPWSGDDCSMDSTAAPDLVEQFEGGLCDVTARDCGVARLLGINIRESVYCHVTQVELSESGVVIIGEEVSFAGDFQSINEVHCPLPEPFSYFIEISNAKDEQRSNRTLHLAHNALCHECIVNEDYPMMSLCTRTADTCLISNACYATGESPPDDACKVCDASVSDSEWQTSLREGCNSGALSMAAIVGIAVGACAVVVGIIAAVMVPRALRKKQKTISGDEKGKIRTHHPQLENPCYKAEDYANM